MLQEGVSSGQQEDSWRAVDTGTGGQNDSAPSRRIKSTLDMYQYTLCDVLQSPVSHTRTTLKSPIRRHKKR